jgi:7-cyano-7-deazaguanine synthase in queuosine biosynthesis
VTTKEILLYSAGLDSLIAWHYLGKPQALHFDIGDRNRNQEYRAIDNLARRCGITLAVSRELDLAQWETPDGVIPLRHMHLIMLACHRADTIWCTGVKDEHAADKNPEAFAYFSAVVSEFAGREIRVDSPFWGMTKTEVVRWYIDQSLPVKDLLDTYSCATSNGSILHCGQCEGCLRRWVALTNNGIEARFAANPWEWERVRNSFLPATSADACLRERRDEELVTALASVGVCV